MNEIYVYNWKGIIKYTESYKNSVPKIDSVWYDSPSDRKSMLGRGGGA